MEDSALNRPAEESDYHLLRENMALKYCPIEAMLPENRPVLMNQNRRGRAGYSSPSANRGTSSLMWPGVRFSLTSRK